MNAWGMLYESLHSALIDVLNCRYPGIQPELGLPQACAAWIPPSGVDPARCATRITRSDLILTNGPRSQGLCCLILKGRTTDDFWPEVLRMALLEFETRSRNQPKLRGVRLTFHEESSHDCFPGWSQKAPPARLVWTPIRLNPDQVDSLQVFLGLAIHG